MSISHLNDEEKNILLQLSYFNLPEERIKGKSIKEIWNRAKRMSGDNGGEARRAALSEFFNDPEKYENSNLADVKLKDYANNNPNMDGKTELDLLAMHGMIFYHICLFLNAYHPIMNVDKY
ncbi:hypothetical protein [Aquibacillus kalidii]|uniref:hypothetical protein n=1 Tax=Aquibacillus kalidii TaxID=2762597 RepID=UPI001645A536|nr:hypothetical protein [Aquibacillus kalidii]